MCTIQNKHVLALEEFSFNICWVFTKHDLSYTCLSEAEFFVNVDRTRIEQNVY